MNVEQNIKKQKILGMKGTILFITLMNMFIPLSIDLYLPALPTMSSYFGVSNALINLTLVSFYLFFAIGTLFWGPISDKYGRKPVLVVGSVLYVAASFVCAISFSVYMLIAARILHGIAAGAVIAVSMALIKDCFAGKQRETILAIVQSVGGVAPMIAPVLGAILLQFTDWRGSFVVLTLIGALCLLLSLAYQETLPEEERYHGTIVGSLGRLVTVGKNVGFLVPCLIFSLYSLAFMGYIAMNSYIYIDYFGLDEQTYSYFYAVNAALSTIGPMLYVKFFLNINKRKFASICFIGYTLCGALMLLVGHISPVLFWIGFAPFSLLGTISRPFSTNILLEQQSGDTGSASSLINGVTTLFGSAGMMCASVWSDSIFGLSFMIFISGLISIIGWMLLMRSKVPCHGVK